MDPLVILRQFLISEDREFMKLVFLHPLGWSVAANGSCVVAYKGEVGESIKDPPALEFLSGDPPSSSSKFKLSSLKSWIAKSKIRPKMGDLLDVPLKFQGLICGVNIDLRRFAFILDCLSDEDVMVWSSTSQVVVKSISFESGPWRACLAGVASSPDEVTNTYDDFCSTSIECMFELESE